MQADPVAQQMLLELVELDTQRARLRHRKMVLPENAELNRLAKKRAGLAEQVVAAETRLADAIAAQERVEADLAPARARLKRNRHIIDAGNADPKALQAMIAETEHLSGRIEHLEDQALEAMQLVEDETAAVDACRAQRVEVENQMRRLLASRDTAGRELDAQAARLGAQRAQLVAGLPAELLTLYDRVAQRSGGVGAAELRARRCGGCGLELDISEIKRHAAASADAVLRCEECGRILVHTDRSGL